MRTVIAIPPLSRMTGGIAVLYQVAARLRELGGDVALAGAVTAPGLTEQAAAGFAVVPWEAVARREGPLFLDEDDIFCIAEGWPGMMAPALAAGSRVAVYAQNWMYVDSAMPEGASWDRFPASFLAVSHPVAVFLETMAHIVPRAVVRPMIDTSLFHPRFPAGHPPAGKTVRIAWMPRKNRALAEQIMRIAGGMDRGAKPRMEWVEIRNMTPGQVAETLASCHIFLSTGFPEGFSLPPLEAMASGCLVVGFTGFGGWDYMRQAEPGIYTPRLEPRPVPWTGNGLFAPDGDVVEAAWLLHEAVAMVRSNAPEYAAIREQAMLTAAAYSADAQREDVRLAWDRLEGKFS